MNFVCNGCGSIYKKWIGQCTSCEKWGTVKEETFAYSAEYSSAKRNTSMLKMPKVEMVSLTNHSCVDATRLATGLDELDRVLGGGFIEGGVILIGGEPGIGKSTLLLQIAGIISNLGKDVLYVSGEESVSQIAMRSNRLAIHSEHIKVCTTSAVLSVLHEVKKAPPYLMIIDSIQTMFVQDIESSPGTVNQIRATSFELINFCKNESVALVIVGHITKDGVIAGPKLLEHMVDTVIYFESDNSNRFRILRTVKNRFGSINEIGIFAMGGSGLEMIKNSSEIFLSSRERRSKGLSVFVAIEGTRCVVTEVESLVLQSYIPSPRRNVIGWDSGRLAMIVAVLQSCCKMRFYDQDIYLNMSGGFKTLEPAADLAVMVSLIVSKMNFLLTDDYVVLGEVSLSGQVRQVSWLEKRVQESVKLGYKKIIVPKMKDNNTLHVSKLITVYQVSHVNEIARLFEDCAT